MSDVDEYGLTARQRRFAERYIVDFDKNAAAEEAGFDTGMVPSLLSHPLVKTAIETLNKERIAALKMTQDEAEIHLKEMAEPKFSDFYEQKDGKLVVKEEIPPDKLAAVKEVRENKDGSQTLVFYPRDLLLDKVLRRHGAFNHVNRLKVEGQVNHEHHHRIDVPSLMQEMDHLLRTRPKQIEAEVIDSADTQKHE